MQNDFGRLSTHTNRKWNKRFLALAQHIAGWSKDPSTQVGAVIVDRNRKIISVGYNGFPSSMGDLRDRYHDRDDKYDRIIHAEMNALLTAQRPMDKDMVLYTWPMLPCHRCVVHLLQAGLRIFVAPDTDNARWLTSLAKTCAYVDEAGGLTILENM